MAIIELAKTAAGITSIIALASFFGALYFWYTFKGNKTSLLNAVDGDGIERKSDVIEIMSRFQSEEKRMEALKEVLGHDERRIHSLLSKVKGNVDAGSLSMLQRRNFSLGLLMLGLVLTALALIVAYNQSSPPRDAIVQPPRSDTPENFLK